MDGISGAASVTAIVAVSFQSIQVIHDVVSGIRNGPDQIRCLVDSVEDLRGILDRLQIGIMAMQVLYRLSRTVQGISKHSKSS